MAKGYRLFVASLMILVAAYSAPQFTGGAAAQPTSTEESRVAPPKRPMPPREEDRFRQFVERHRDTKLNKENLTQLIELVRAWRMMQEVGLTEEQSLKFLHLRREMKEQAGKIAKQRERAQRELKKLLDDPQAEDATIARQIETLERIEEKGHALFREHEKKMLSELTVRQQAKLKLFKIGFERDMRGLIEHIKERHERAARERPRGRRQPHPPGVPDRVPTD